MLFNSWTFWIFFAVVLPLYWVLPHKAQNRFLLAASYVFYGWWDWRFLPLILFSTAMDFTLGNVVAASRTARGRKACIWVSVALNLTLLGIFKYYGFFSSQLAAALGRLGLGAPLPVLHIILPVGISFYTFQSMSYVIDIYRGISAPAKSFWDFALYVAFFPHLVAGPIMRSGLRKDESGGSGLLKQIVTKRRLRDGDFREGLYYILSGLFRKIVIGDNMAAITNAVFGADVAKLSGLECAAGMYAFAFQVYGDFSGYSMIAQGLAKWMGIDLMANFRQPFFATSAGDFWRRWHISLSTWLRDYVYISLGGSRTGRAYRNVMITMVLGGLWHGANWTYLVWGAYCGVLLCAYRRLPGGKEEPARNPFAWASSVFIHFQFFVLGLLIFRSSGLGHAWQMFVKIVTDPRPTPLAMSLFALILFYAGPLMLFELWLERRKELTALLRTPWLPRALAYAYGALMLIYFPAPVAHEFIYFQF
jgi:alginate O-acetyltransferase complex protein AlgI